MHSKMCGTFSMWRTTQSLLHALTGSAACPCAQASMQKMPSGRAWAYDSTQKRLH